MRRRRFWVLLGIALLMTGLLSFWRQQVVTPVTSVANVTLLSRGVNLAHWFSQFPEDLSEKHLGTWITETDFKNLADVGMTHVRLPVAPDKLSKEQFVYIDQAVKWANKYHLATILDIHPTSPLFVENKIDSKALDELKQFWVEFARRYQREPKTVFYELLSESQVEDSPVWHDVAESLVKTIRQIDQQHTLIVAAPNWSLPEDFLSLVPVTDKNVVYTFHFYKPMAFTHQGAYWIDGGLGALHDIPYPYNRKRFEQATRGITEPQALSWLSEYDKYDQKKLARDLQPVLNFRNRYHLPVYCGELGVYKWGTPEVDRRHWYHDLTQLLQQNEIGYALWEYRSGFAIFDKGTNQFDRPLLEAIGLKS
jgi:hypothetical protein